MAWFLASIMLIGMLAVFLLIRFYITGPVADTVAQLLSAQIAVIINHSDHRVGSERKVLDLSEFERYGLRFRNAINDTPPGELPAFLYLRRLEESIQAIHGTEVQLRIEHGDTPMLWLMAQDMHPIWIGFPVQPLRAIVSPILVIWLGGIALLSFIGAALAARHVNRPLRHLAKAASVVGQGELPRPVETRGPAEIRALASAFNRMAKDVDRLAQDRVLFLAGVSHDLRTPLTRLRLAVEMLSPADPELAAGVVQDLDDMEATIAQFMAYVREGSPEPREAVDFNNFTESIMRREIPDGIPFETRFAPLPPVQLHPTAMRRLLANLAENAVQHGRGTAITITTETDKGSVILRVRDRGPGVPKADLERLFEPFTRVQTARGGKGSGLGLAIARRIAEMHGGRISLRNHPDGGAEVVLRLTIGKLVPPWKRRVLGRKSPTAARPAHPDSNPRRARS